MFGSWSVAPSFSIHRSLTLAPSIYPYLPLSLSPALFRSLPLSQIPFFCVTFIRSFSLPLSLSLLSSLFTYHIVTLPPPSPLFNALLHMPLISSINGHKTQHTTYKHTIHLLREASAANELWIQLIDRDKWVLLIWRHFLLFII